MLKHMVHKWWQWKWWISSMENFVKLKLLSLVQQNRGCAGTRPRSILALGVWVLHFKFTFRHVFLRLPISHISKDPAGQAYLEDPEDDKGLKDHSDRIRGGWSVGVTRRARRRGGKPRWLSHSTSCTYSPWKVNQLMPVGKMWKLFDLKERIHVPGIDGSLPNHIDFHWRRKSQIYDECRIWEFTLNHCRSATGLSASAWQKQCNARCGKIESSPSHECLLFCFCIELTCL